MNSFVKPFQGGSPRKTTDDSKRISMHEKFFVAQITRHRRNLPFLDFCLLESIRFSSFFVVPRGRGVRDSVSRESKRYQCGLEHEVRREVVKSVEKEEEGKGQLWNRRKCEYTCFIESKKVHMEQCDRASERERRKNASKE